MEIDDAANILATSDFFAPCGPEQLRLLAFTCERRRLRPGDVLATAGEIPEGAFLLISGMVRTEDGRSGPGASHRIGQPGTILTELALVINKPARATITALTSADTLYVPRASFTKLCRQFPPMAEWAAERIRMSLADYVDALQQVKPLFLDER